MEKLTVHHNNDLSIRLSSEDYDNLVMFLLLADLDEIYGNRKHYLNAKNKTIKLLQSRY